MEGGKAIGRGGGEGREGGRLRKKEGGRTEGTLEGWRERGIGNREHLGKLWVVIEIEKRVKRGGRTEIHDRISRSLDVCGPWAVKLVLKEQEGKEKGEGEGQ